MTLQTSLSPLSTPHSLAVSEPGKRYKYDYSEMNQRFGEKLRWEGPEQITALFESCQEETPYMDTSVPAYNSQKALGERTFNILTFTDQEGCAFAAFGIQYFLLEGRNEIENVMEYISADNWQHWKPLEGLHKRITEMLKLYPEGAFFKSYSASPKDAFPIDLDEQEKVQTETLLNQQKLAGISFEGGPEGGLFENSMKIGGVVALFNSLKGMFVDLTNYLNADSQKRTEIQTECQENGSYLKGVIQLEATLNLTLAEKMRGGLAQRLETIQKHSQGDLKTEIQIAHAKKEMSRIEADPGQYSRVIADKTRPRFNVKSMTSELVRRNTLWMFIELIDKAEKLLPPQDILKLNLYLGKIINAVHKFNGDIKNRNDFLISLQNVIDAIEKEKDNLPEDIQREVQTFCIEGLGIKIKELDEAKKSCAYFEKHPIEVALLGGIERSLLRRLPPPRLRNADEVMSLALRSFRIFMDVLSHVHKQLPSGLCFTKYDPPEGEQYRFFTDPRGRMVAGCSLTNKDSRLSAMPMSDEHPMSTTLFNAATDFYNRRAEGIIPALKAIEVVKPLFENKSEIVNCFKEYLKLDVVMDLAIKWNMFSQNAPVVRLVDVNPGYWKQDEGTWKDGEVKKQLTNPQEFKWNELLELFKKNAELEAKNKEREAQNLKEAKEGKVLHAMLPIQTLRRFNGLSFVAAYADSLQMQKAQFDLKECEHLLLGGKPE